MSDIDIANKTSSNEFGQYSQIALLWELRYAHIYIAEIASHISVGNLCLNQSDI